ncbi:ABC transporter ATP-binding protein [Caenibacillus caldisaponilyticus]|uniref:ABC transporter ATP-binding protein n=1 Tax=Caenibacillus caldisaponilyticus TaxID=1674942 RepID=UPI0009884876|nr:ABC transporter ATP-binding protein [Caenibacillus caldisaponilyticus]
MIELNGLTKTFANGRGIFDLSFRIPEGEVFGYLGPNGAGKSTTIRHLMGFLKPEKGSAAVCGHDCWRQAPLVHQRVGYLPGELAFPEGITGRAFLRLMAGMRGTRDEKRRDALLERFQLNPDIPIRKMSKGTKQKLAMVAAFMHDPAVYILDEPTSGLDPVMQKVFVDLILEEKNRGKTVLMSSHSFREIEKTCDRIAIIKQGRLIAIEDIHTLQRKQRKIFEVTFGDEEAAKRAAANESFDPTRRGRTVDFVVQGDYNAFLDAIRRESVVNVSVHEQDLEDIFMDYYAGEGDGR